MTDQNSRVTPALDKFELVECWEIKINFRFTVGDSGV